MEYKSDHDPLANLLDGLTDEQIEVITLAKNGHDIFFTGPAGTGKSKILEQLYYLFHRLGKLAVFTAPTGIAAKNIPNGRGRTLHSFARLPPFITDHRENDMNQVYNYLCDKGHLFSQFSIEEIDVLIIDEISMVDPFILDFISLIVRNVRKSDEYSVDDLPWSNLQVIMCGDFYQLPPVIRSNKSDSTKQNINYKYAFQADVWKWMSCCTHLLYHGFSTVQLTQNFRQCGEPEFINLLNQIRIGKLPSENQAMDIMKHVDFTECIDEHVTYICYTNNTVTAKNNEALRKLEEGETQEYQWKEWYDSDYNEKDIKELRNDHTLEDRIVLRVGARVMLLANKICAPHTNGSTGVIVGFVNASDNQKPKGDMYENVRLPIVRFDGCDQEVTIPFYTHERTILKKIVCDDQFAHGRKKIHFEEHMIYSVQQVPLRLAWAMTVHKAQGLTLPGKIIIDLEGFRKKQGLLYVAMSRARSMHNVQLYDFHKSYVSTPPVAVSRFYESKFRILEATTYTYIDITRKGFNVKSHDGILCAEYTWRCPQCNFDQLNGCGDISLYDKTDNKYIFPVVFLSHNPKTPSYVACVTNNGAQLQWKIYLSRVVILGLIKQKMRT